MDRKDSLILVLLLSLISITVLAEPKFIVENSGGTDNFWVNDTGSVYFAEDLLCTNCINPEDVNDIDKEDIETDLNTFVDIAGDTMTGDLTIPEKIIHSGNVDTYLRFTTDIIELWAGGVEGLTIDTSGSVPYKFYVNQNNGNLDFIHGKQGGGTNIFSDASTGKVGILTGGIPPVKELDVVGTINATKNITSDAMKLADNKKQYFGDDDDVCQYWNGTDLVTESPCG